MRVVITGAGGFLGEYLINTCLKNNEKFKIIAVTSKAEKLKKKLTEKYDKITIVSSKQLEQINWEQEDILLNCAFPRNNDGIQMAEGLKFITEVITKATNVGVRAVVNISSQSVYSQTRMESATEETPLNLETKYAVGKYATELITNSICRKIPHTNLRMASLIGIGFDQRITNKFVMQVINGQDLTIIGGQQRFGFLDVRDAVEGILAVLKSKPEKWQETYNLGTNESCSLREIANIVSELGEEYLGKKINVFCENSNDWKNSGIICDKFFQEFSWMPRYSVKNTIDMLLEYYKQSNAI